MTDDLKVFEQNVIVCPHCHYRYSRQETKKFTARSWDGCNNCDTVFQIEVIYHPTFTTSKD